MPIRAMLPPADSNAYCPGESRSTDKRTVCASNPNGPRKLKSTVLDDVTVARVTIRNCRRYDWMLARRALHSANGWLICKVFCKSIGIKVFGFHIEQKRCHPFSTSRVRVADIQIVFVFFTILYQLKTLRSLVESGII